MNLILSSLFHSVAGLYVVDLFYASSVEDVSLSWVNLNVSMIYPEMRLYQSSCLRTKLATNDVSLTPTPLKVATLRDQVDTTPCLA